MLRLERLFCHFLNRSLSSSAYTAFYRPPDHYSVLGVNRNATSKTIKSAFYELSNKYHPDRNPEDKANASAKFQAILNAYEVLSNAEKRRQYDSQFISPQMEGESASMQRNYGKSERRRYTSSSSKDLEVSRKRDLYRANALDLRIDRWNESARDTVKESITKDPDVQVNWSVAKEIARIMFFMILLLGLLKSFVGRLDFETEPESETPTSQS